MKLLLVQVPTSHLGAGEKVYPLGLSRLSALVPGHVDKHGLDMNICPDPWNALKQALETHGPDTVALSFRNLDPLAGHQASYLSSLKTAARMVRKLRPKATIMAGGPAFSLFGQRLMEEIPQIDIGLTGEGEPVFESILAAGPDLQAVPGLIRREGPAVVAPSTGPKMSMDHIPSPDVRTFNPLDYTRGNAYVAAIGIEGKRGCDLNCAYCLYPFLGGTCMRLRSPDAIADEMEMFRDAFGIRLFHFTDGVVNRPPAHFEALCQTLIRRKLDVSWTGFFREDSLTRQNLDLARKAGLTAIYFSADALTARQLKLLNKRLTPDQILEASRITAEQNMLTMCHFLVNLPGDNDREIASSWQFLDRLLDIHQSAGNLGAVIFNHVRLYPGAPLTRRLIRSGDLDPAADLLYPVYHNPAPFTHVLHEFEAHCHSAGVFSRFGLDPLP